MTSKRRAGGALGSVPAVAWLIALTTVAAAAAPPAARGVVTVSAAVSLSEALEAVGRAWEEAGGDTVRFNFAASNVLSRQIVSGAPVDLFVSADDAQMDLAARAGAIDIGSRVPLLGNRLAIVMLPGRAGLTDARGLLGPGVRRIAIGDPAAVPAGVYARQYLERIGIWDALQAKLVPVSSVRAALAAVDSGGVDAAFTYVTDAAVARRARTALIVTGPDAPRITYPAAIVAAAPHRRAAERLLAYLRGPAAAAIFSRSGFQPLAGTGS